MNSQNMTRESDSECVQYAMNEGIVARPTPIARTQQTRRASNMNGRENSHAVPMLASTPATRWMLPVTAPASPTLRPYARIKNVGVHQIKPQPHSEQTPLPMMM